MSVALVYPASLPGPTAAPTEAFERRRMTVGGRYAARAVSRDKLYQQQLRFVYDKTHAAVFDAWWRDDLVYGGAWFLAVWHLPPGRTGVAHRFSSVPKWQFLGNGFWEVLVDCTVRVVGMDPLDNTDPYGAYVVSLLNFENSFGPPPGLGGSVLITNEDEKNVDWTLWAYDGDQPTFGGGQLTLPGVTFVDGFTFGALASQSKSSFAASGDFTMEFRHSAVGDLGGNYRGSTAILMLAGAADAHWTGPAATGEWALSHTNSSLSFIVKPSGLGTVSAAATGYSYPYDDENEVAITRKDGILRLFINGVKIATQASAADNTTLYPQVTFGSNGTGAGALAAVSNNFGWGNFKRWRYTVGVARYIDDYEPLAAGLRFPPIKA